MIGADASLTGYAGGLTRKRWLLGHEAAHEAGPAMSDAEVGGALFSAAECAAGLDHDGG